MSSRSSSFSDSSFDQLSDSEFSDSEHSESDSEIAKDTEVAKDSESNLDLQDSAASEVQSQKDSESEVAPRTVTLSYEAVGGTKTQVTLALTRVSDSEDSDSELNDSEPTDAVPPVEVHGYHPNRRARDVFVFIVWLLAFFLFMMYLAPKDIPLPEHDLTISDLVDMQEYRTQQDHSFASLEQALKLKKALEKFNSLPKNDRLQLKHWKPLPSAFVGVKEYLEKSGKTGTHEEMIMHMASPRIQHENGKRTLGFQMEFTNVYENMVDSFSSRVSIENGELRITEWRKINEEYAAFTRFFYYPLKNLLEMV